MTKLNLFEGKISMGKPVIQWDKAVKGLGIRLNCDGSRVFIAKVSINGNPKWFTLGSMEVITHEQARALVQRMKLMARSGEEPDIVLKGFWKSEDNQIETFITFGQFVPKYIEQYAKVYKKSWLKDEQRINLYLLEKWANRPLKDIRRTDFIAIFSALGKKKKIAANRLKETTTTLFNQAIVLGYLKEGHPNPTFGVKAFKESPRRVKIDFYDLPKLAEVVRTYPDPVYRNALLFILFTGLRHSEAVGLRWSWFDFERKTFTLPMTKNGEAHTLPITAPLERLLKQIRRTSSPYLFPSKVTDSHIVRLDRAWRKVRKQAGFPNVTIHDLRRSVGCMVLQQTGSLTAVRDLLNHSNEHISAVYGFYDDKGLKPIMEKYNEAMEKALGI